MDEAIFDPCVVFMPLFLLSAKTSQRNNLFKFSSHAIVSQSAPFQLAKLAFKGQLGTCVCLLEPLAPFQTMRIM
jgi:hypothetical protein